MEPKTTSKEEDKLEKELKSLVSRMKNENSALKKILVQLKSEAGLPEAKIGATKKNTNQ